MLNEWLKGLLSISWNQRHTKKKQIVLRLASIKFRQPVEIDSGKKCAKWKGREDYSIHVPKHEHNILWILNYDASVGGDKLISGKWILKSSRCVIVIGLLFSVTLILIVPLEI